MPSLRYWLLLALALASLRTGADPSAQADAPFDLGLDLRYRYEGVDQAGLPQTANANTLRIRGRLSTRAYAGFSGLLELDHVEALGAQEFNDTRNGQTDYPVVADPEGSDLNQAWLQYAPRAHTRIRLGRQRLNLDNQRFVGASEWRQNEQTLDAVWIETTALRRLTVNYSFVDRVNRVFGPDSGTPPESFQGATHLFNVKLDKVAAGSLVAYAYLLDFDEASQLSSDSFGARYDGAHEFRDGLSVGWALEYAQQQDAGDNPLRVDASYALAELHLKARDADFFVGREVLSGERDAVDPSISVAFQTPLATLHKWQGWADKFLTTPSTGIEDTYLGFLAQRSGWRAQAVWHDFGAEATGLHYGSEIDLLVAGTIAKRLEVLLKYADYRADEGFTDTRKFWAQLGMSF
jgi:hypothetical protein